MKKITLNKTEKVYSNLKAAAKGAALILCIALGTAWQAHASWPITVSSGYDFNDNDSETYYLADGNGGFYQVWSATAPEHPGYPQMYAQHVSLTGALMWNSGVPMRVSVSTNAQGSHASPVGDGSGGIIIFWQEYEGTSVGDEFPSRIFLHRIAPDGMSVWGPKQVSPGYAGGGELIETLDGGAAVGMGIEGVGGVVQRLDSSGNCQWPTADADCVHNSTGAVLIAANLSNAGLIRGATAGSGYFVWTSNDLGSMDIYGAKWSASGSLVWSKPLVTGPGDQALDELDVLEDGNDGFYIVWDDTRAAGNYTEVYATHVDADGNAVGAFTIGDGGGQLIAAGAEGKWASPEEVAVDPGGLAVVYSTIAAPDNWSTSAEYIARVSSGGGSPVWDVPFGQRNSGDGLLYKDGYYYIAGYAHNNGHIVASRVSAATGALGTIVDVSGSMPPYYGSGQPAVTDSQNGVIVSWRYNTAKYADYVSTGAFASAPPAVMNPSVGDTLPQYDATNVSPSLSSIDVIFTGFVYPYDNSAIGSYLQFGKTMDGSNFNYTSLFQSFQFVDMPVPGQYRYRITLTGGNLDPYTQYMVKVQSFCSEGMCMDTPYTFNFNTGQLIQYGNLAGTITFAGDRPGDSLVVKAWQWLSGNDEVLVSSVVIPLAGGTTQYAYSLPVQADRSSKITGYVLGNPDMNGQIESGGMEVGVGQTSSGHDFTIYSATGSINMTINYSGSHTGNFYVAFMDNIDGSPIYMSAVSSGAPVTVYNVPAPANLYIFAFVDENGDMEPRGFEPLGYKGTWGPMAYFNTNAVAVAAASDTVVDAGSIDLHEMGSVAGTLNLGLNSGNFRVALVHGDPLAGSLVVEDDEHLYVNTVFNCSTCVYTALYDFSGIVPGTDYAVFAYFDRNDNRSPDAGETFGLSSLGLSVVENATTTVNMPVTQRYYGGTSDLTVNLNYLGSVNAGNYSIVLSTDLGDPYTGAGYVYSPSASGTFKGLSSNTTYFIFSSRDTDSSGSYQKDAVTEPMGWMSYYMGTAGSFSTPLNVVDPAVMAVTLSNKPAGDRVIAEFVNIPGYSGYIESTTDSYFETGVMPSPYFGYDVTINAFVDNNPENGQYDAGESSVTYSVWASSSASNPVVLTFSGGGGGGTPVFSGDFNQTSGAVYDGGDMDMAQGLAYNNGYVYGIAISSGIGGIVYKYDTLGNKQAHAVITELYPTGIAVNNNGVYVTGQIADTGFGTYRYNDSLVLISSAVLSGDASARGITVDNSGNVYVIGSESEAGPHMGPPSDYKFVKYSYDLASPVLGTFDAGGNDEGYGVAVDNTDSSVYLAGYNFIGGTTNYVTAKLNSSLAFVSSGAYTNAYFSEHSWMSIAFKDSTRELFLTGAVPSAQNGRDIGIVRYNSGLAQTAFYQWNGADDAAFIKIAQDGNIYVQGNTYDGMTNDDVVVGKFDADLGYIASAIKSFDQSYEPGGIALDSIGNVYAAGTYLGGAENEYDVSTGKFPYTEFTGGGGGGTGNLQALIDFQGSGSSGDYVVLVSSVGYGRMVSNPSLQPDTNFQFFSLPAPATYYVFAFRDTDGNFQMQRNTGEPFGIARIFVPEGGLGSGTITIVDPAPVAVTMNNKPAGTAYLEFLLTPDEMLREMAPASPWNTELPPSTYFNSMVTAFAFVDNNMNNVYDEGEPNGTSSDNWITGGVPNYITVNFGGGGPVEAGTMTVTAVNAALPYGKLYNDAPMLKFTLAVNSGEAYFNGIELNIVGSVVMANNEISDVAIAKEINGDGKYNYYDDQMVGNIWNMGVSTFTVTTYSNEVITTTPSVYYVLARPNNFSALGKTVSVSIQSKNAFTLSKGYIADGSYPMTSAQMEVSNSVFAGNYENYGNFWVGYNQTANIESTGTWSAGGSYGETGPAGSGSCSAGCKIESAPRGALVARVGYSGAWQLIGVSSTISSGENSGDLFLAMNDDDYYDGNYGELFFKAWIQAKAARWTGNGVTDYATDANNWEGNMPPGYGDDVVFDGVGTNADKQCDWDIFWNTSKSLTLGPSFTGTVRIVQSPSFNQLTVDNAIDIQGGTLDTNGQSLQAKGGITVGGASNGTLFLNAVNSNSPLYLGSAGLTVTSSGTFRSGGASSAFISGVDYGQYPIYILGGTVTVNSAGGTTFDNVLGITLNTGNAVMNNVSFMGLQPGVAALILNPPSGANLTFNNWNFDGSVSTNVNTAGAAYSFNLVMTNASGPKMGSVNERGMDPNNYVTWSPEGGLSGGEIEGQVSYSGSTGGSLYVYLSTSNNPTDPYVLMYSSAQPSFPHTYHFVDLTAPATYYVYAYADGNNNPQGSYGKPGEVYGATGIYLAQGSLVQTGKNITLDNQGTFAGTILKNGDQQGWIIVEAWHATGGLLANKIEFPGYYPYMPYSIPVAPGSDYYVRVFTDVDGDKTWDSFEGSGQFGPNITATAGVVEDNVNLEISSGTAVPGGTMFVSYQPFSGYMSKNTYESEEPILNLGVWTDGLDAYFKYLSLLPAGTSDPSSFKVDVYRDYNGNGMRDYDDEWTGNGYFTASSTAPVVIDLDHLSAPPLVTAATRYFLITAGVINPGQVQNDDSIGVIVSSSGMGLTQGQVSEFAPITSGIRTVKPSVNASAAVCYSEWCGAYMDVNIYGGQTLSISATGQWTVQGTQVDARGGNTYGGIVPGAPLGALIARIGNNPWIYVGTGTTLQYTGFGGGLKLGMNKCDNCSYNDTFGKLFISYAVTGSTTATVMGTITYDGLTSGSITIEAKQWNESGLQVAASTSVALVGGTTVYPYVFSGIPGQRSSMIFAHVSSDEAQMGGYPGDLWLEPGAVRAGIDFRVNPGAGTINSTLSYSGAQTQGVVTAVLFKSFESQPVYTSTCSAAGEPYSAVGTFSLPNVPGPDQYYMAVFIDFNNNGEPDGPEPLGYFGNPGPLSQIGANAVQVAVASAATVNVPSITLYDMGQINGTLALGQLHGEVGVEVWHGAPGGLSSVRENWKEYYVEMCGWTGCANQLEYSLGTLSPGSDYAVFAYVDDNKNRQFDAGEKFGVSQLNLSVSANAVTFANMSIQETLVPPPPPSLTGVAEDVSQIRWTWQDVLSETGYKLLDSTGGFITSLPANTTYYLEDIGTGNTAGAIRGIKSANSYGDSNAVFVPQPVYTLAVIPSVEIVSRTESSIGINLSISGNSAGTRYGIQRSTSSSGGFVTVLAGTAPVAGYLDEGLSPSAAYYYRARTFNAANIASGFSDPMSASTVTLMGAGYSIAGAIIYSGQQSGPIIVRAFTGADFTGLVKSISLQGGNEYYLGDLTNGVNYYVRAFVDVTGDGIKTTNEDSGVAANPINVTGAMAGKNISLMRDTIAPKMPTLLTASAGFMTVNLSWTASVSGDALGYEIERSTSNTFAGNVMRISSSAPAGYATGTAYTDNNPVTGVYSYYRMRTLDWGMNVSSWTSPASVRATSGGSITGIVHAYDTASQGSYHVRVSTSPDANISSIADIIVSTSPNTYTVTGLSDGVYYMRGYRDVNGDFTQSRRNEPSGTHGGIARPFDLYVTQGNTITGKDLIVCNRVPLAVGVSTVTAISEAACRALDRGPDYYTRIFTFEVGYGAGKVTPGSQLNITANAVNGGFSDSYLYLIGPSGDVVTQDDDSNGNGNARINYTVQEEGIYLLEPTSFSPASSGDVEVAMNITGGYNGMVSGTVGYLGSPYANQGQVYVQVFNNLDPYAWPMRFVTASSTGTFEIEGLQDGNFYLKAYWDINNNSMRDAFEPYGYHGSSAPAAFNVSGGLTTDSLNIIMTDPPMGAVSGTLSYTGSKTGNIRIEAGKVRSDCPDCGTRDLDIKKFTYLYSVDRSTTAAYTLTLLEPATQYYIRAYMDLNSNNEKDVLEPYVSSGTINIIAGSTATGVNLLLRDPGTGTTGNSNISGYVHYTPSAGSVSTGTVWIGWALDDEFDNVPYWTTSSSRSVSGGTASWYYSKTNILGNATYYMAAFLDLNGNGLPDDMTLGEPLGFYGTGGEFAPLYIPVSSNAAANVTVQEPAKGSLSGTIYYSNSNTNYGAVRVEAWVENCQGNGCGNRTQINWAQGVASYPFTLNFMGASTSYHLYAFMDTNNSGNHDQGEPNAWSDTSYTVAEGLPTAGVQLNMFDPGQFIGVENIGRISGLVSYSGQQAGSIIVRMFDNAGRTGAPVRTFNTCPAGSSCSYEFLNLSGGMYYLDAYMDTSANGIYDGSFEAYGIIGNSAGINISPAFNQIFDQNGNINDPAYVLVSTGSRAISGAISVLSQNTAGKVRIQLFRYNADKEVMRYPIRSIAENYTQQPVFYSFTDVDDGNYLVQAFLDSNDNYWPDSPQEAWGQSKTVDLGTLVPASGVNFKACYRASIQSGVQVVGSLAASDCVSPERPSSYLDYYTFEGRNGDVVTIEMTGTGFSDKYLYLYRPSTEETGTPHYYNLAASAEPDYVTGNAAISAFTLRETGQYVIGATSLGGAITGEYRLSLNTSGSATGAIAGDARYNGTQGGMIRVGLFNTTDLKNSEPLRGTDMTVSGPFNFTGLPTGSTYYIAGFMDVNLDGNINDGEDFGVYGPSLDNPTPIVLRAGQNISGLQFAINTTTVTPQGPVPAVISGFISYTGAFAGTLRVEAWNDSKFQGYPVAVRSVETGYWPTAYDMQLPGNSQYYFKAFLDMNGNAMPDANEPKGAYQPNNQGPEPRYVSEGEEASGVDFALYDPGISGGDVKGEGWASILPAQIPAGSMFDSTITVRVGPNGLSQNGVIAFSLPFNFYGGLQTGCPQCSNYVSFSTGGAVNPPIAALNSFGSGAEIRLAAGQSLSEGASVYIMLKGLNSPCETGTAVFHVGTSKSGSTPAPLVNGEPSSALVAGTAANISMRMAGSENSYNITLPANSISTMVVEGRDMCWNPAPFAGVTVATVSGQSYDYATGAFAADPNMQFSRNVGLAALAAGQTGITIPAGVSSATFHVRPLTAGFHNIALSYNLGYANTSYMGVQVMAGQAITGANISTGTYNSALTQITINPVDNARAYINFALSDPSIGWHVIISSRTFREGVTTTAIWESWGWGQPYLGQVVWDGHYSPWINYGSVVPSGVYYVKIEVGSLSNTDLRIDVTVPQVSGRVLDAGVVPSRPLAGVNINASGPSGWGQTVTDSNGNYSIPGLAAGTYNFQFTKPEYASISTNVIVNAAGATRNASMRGAPALILIPSFSGVNSNTADQWGWINVHTDNWDRVYNGGLRLIGGTTNFDDGGSWDASTGQIVYRSRIRFDVEAGTYTVDAQLYGYGNVSATAYVGSIGAVVNLSPFSRKANVSGLVKLPAGALNANGTWISVNAMPQDMSSSNQGAWGGIWLEPNLSSGTYNLFGVDPGTYVIRGQVPGFSGVSSTFPVVVAYTDRVVDLPEFNTGGQITGTVSIKGSASAMSNFELLDTKPECIDGQHNGCAFKVWINVWSPATFSNGWAEVYLSTGTVSGSEQIASSAYTITGLESNSSYQLFANLDRRSNGPGEFSTPGGFPKIVPVPVTNNAGDFSFELASGVINGTIYLPETVNGAPTTAADFQQVSMTGRILNSDNPYATTDSGIYMADITGTSGGEGLPGLVINGSRAVFRVEGLETQTMEIIFTFKATGRSKTYQLKVVNGAVTNVVVDLRDETYAVSGAVVATQISNPDFNTSQKIVQNSSFTLAAGYPAYAVGTVIPIEAVRREMTQTGIVLSDTYDPMRTRVGYITAAGSYTVSGLQEGVYTLRTLPLQLCATCAVSVPKQEKIVTVRRSDYLSGNVMVNGTAVSTGAVNFTLFDGVDVSGNISIANDIQDARSLQLTLLNNSNQVVRSTAAMLGNVFTNTLSNSAAYSMAGLQRGGYYTLQVRDVKDSSGTVKYVASPIKFPDVTVTGGLQQNLSNQNVILKQGAFLKFKLRDMNTVSIIAQNNASLLAPNFSCYAISNPWVQGGYYLSGTSVTVNGIGRPVEYDGTVKIGPVLPDIYYDVRCEQTSWDIGYMRQGAQNYSPVIKTGIKPVAGETRDLGVFDLNQGQALTGLVVNSDGGAPLANVKMLAKPSYVVNPMTIQTMTNRDGRYSVWVSTYISRYFDITAAPREQTANVSGSTEVYKETVKRAIDLTKTTEVNFSLEQMRGDLQGTIVTVDSGPLSYPFGDMRGFPVAAVFIQPYGTLPKNNPMGDIEAITDPDGRFEVLGLSVGTYTIRAVSLNYAVTNATFAITQAGSKDIGSVVLEKGATISGAIRKPDTTAPGGWTSPSANEIGMIVAANDGFTEFVVGTVLVNSESNTVDQYAISGFKPDITYVMALVPPFGGDIVFPVEGMVRFTQAESTASVPGQILTFRPAIGDCAATTKRTLDLAGATQFQLKFTCSKALRNRLPSDNDLDAIILSSGTGSFVLGSKTISFDRKQMTAAYKPGAGENRFQIIISSAYINEIDPNSLERANFMIYKTFDFYTGISAGAQEKITNMNGGMVELESASTETEHTSAEFEAGSFALEGSTYAVVNTTVTVVIRRFEDSGNAFTTVSVSKYDDGENIAKIAASKGLPVELYGAILAVKNQDGGGYKAQAGGAGSATNYTPFSSFYDFFLPAGISHTLQKKARITLSYDLTKSTATNNPDMLNVYYLPCSSCSYQIQEDGKAVDPFNNTISVNIGHMSVYTVFYSTLVTVAPVVGSTVAYTGTEFKAYNFPNPFNLSLKTKSTNMLAGMGGYTAGAQCVTRGTCIRIFVPAGMSGNLLLKIYNMAGELVWDDTLPYTAGQTTVYAWNGVNKTGQPVASGVYIGEIKLDGKKDFFKMAVVKDSRYQ